MKIHIKNWLQMQTLSSVHESTKILENQHSFLAKPNFGVFKPIYSNILQFIHLEIFFYFEFRQKVHIVYFLPHHLIGAQIFSKTWNVVLYSYYDGKVLVSDQWRSYKTRELKKSVFLAFFFFQIQFSSPA